MNDTFDLFLLDWSAAHFVALMDSIIQPLRHHEKSQQNENSQQKYIERNKKTGKNPNEEKKNQSVKNPRIQTMRFKFIFLFSLKKAIKCNRGIVWRICETEQFETE